MTAGPWGGLDLGEVLGIGHVADPVQPVLDDPVRPLRVGELGGAGLYGGQAGDGVDRLDAVPRRPVSGRRRRVICSARAACWKPIPAVTAVSFPVRRSRRPCALSMVWSATGTSAQGHDRSCRSRPGCWLRRSAGSACRARSGSWRARVRCVAHQRSPAPRSGPGGPAADRKRPSRWSFRPRRTTPGRCRWCCRRPTAGAPPDPRRRLRPGRRRARSGVQADHPPGRTSCRHQPVQLVGVHARQNPADRGLTQRPRAHPQARADRPGQVARPFADRQVGPCPGQHRADRDGQHRHNIVAHTTAGPGVANCPQRGEQVGRHSRLGAAGRLTLVSKRHGSVMMKTRTSPVLVDHEGKGTVMITSGRRARPRLDPHRYVNPRHARQRNFAGARPPGPQVKRVSASRDWPGPGTSLQAVSLQAICAVAKDLACHLTAVAPGRGDLNERVAATDAKYVPPPSRGNPVPAHRAMRTRHFTY